MADKKIRIRKALSVREQAEVVRAKAATRTEPAKYSRAKGKLRKLNILRFMRPILSPLRWLVPAYFINSWREVRQVTWPNRRETWRLTLAVFIFAIIFGSLVASVDKGLDILFKKLIFNQ